jgi:hypothetical protein
VLLRLEIDQVVEVMRLCNVFGKDHQRTGVISSIHINGKPLITDERMTWCESRLFEL